MSSELFVMIQPPERRPGEDEELRAGVAEARQLFNRVLIVRRLAPVTPITLEKRDWSTLFRLRQAED